MDDALMNDELMNDGMMIDDVAIIVTAIIIGLYGDDLRYVATNAQLMLFQTLFAFSAQLGIWPVAFWAHSHSRNCS